MELTDFDGISTYFVGVGKGINDKKLVQMCRREFMIITIGSIVPDDKGNKYKVIDSIKPGGFGQVFLCERELDKKKFAVKTMLNVFPSTEEYNAFQNELMAAKEIKADNVVLYEFMHDGKMFEEYPPYIIMEFANQGSLQHLLEQKMETQTFFTNIELTQMFLQLASGMKHINFILVHRDIKPDNILIVDGVLKITDFGLAKYAEATTRGITFKGYGTKEYCAPEVWKNEKNTIYMDIYSMGIVFYEIATLKYPYIVAGGDYADAHLYKPVENPTKHNPSLEPKLVSIINKMLQKPKSKRFSDWQEIIDMLSTDDLLGASDSKIVSFAQAAVSMQNAKDNAIQKKQSEDEKKKNERRNHIKNIMFYFNDVILEEIKEYVKVFNLQYASGGIDLNLRNFKLTSESNSITVTMPNHQRIIIKLSVINPENFTEVMGYTQRNGYGVRIPTATRTSIPMCRRKKVLAWGKIEDDNGLGYNILLLENGVDEYGDWFILYNKNSGLARTPRPEPFAFSEDELPRELMVIDATHIYISELQKYDFSRFQDRITRGSIYH